jgi:hypothetical protein
MKEDLLLVWDFGIWRIMVRPEGLPAWQLYSSDELVVVLQKAQDRSGGPVGIPLLSRLMS